MTEFEILQLLNAQEIKVTLKNSKLKVNTPKGAMTPEIMSLLKDNKQRLINYLLEANERAATISKAPEGEDMGLSFAQQRMWFIDQMDSGGVHYNMPSAIRVKGDFKVVVAEETLVQIIQRHETLRTVFLDSSKGPLQVIQDKFSFTIKQIDLSHLSEEMYTKAVQDAMQEDAQKSFNLSQDLMLRVSYLTLSDNEGVMLFNMHHIASDGWSGSILVNEFVTLYKSNLQNLACPLKPLKIQYKDYAYWQRRWLKGTVLERQLSYWDQQLAELPQEHSLLLDFKRPEFQTFKGGKHHFEIDSQTLVGLKTIALENKATLFMVVHAVFSIMLARYSNNSDVVIGTPVANRLQKEVEPLIGFFANTLVLRADCSDNPSFTDFLAQIKSINLDAQANQDVPFEYLVNRLNPTRNTRYNPLFQIMLSMNTNESVELSLPDVSFLPEHNEQQIITKFDLVMQATQVDDILHCSLEYNTDLFTFETIEHMAGSIQQLFRGILDHKTQNIFRLPLLDAEENKLLLHSFNDTKTDHPLNLCIHQLFEQQVELTPNNLAIIFNGHSLSFNELNSKSNQLAHHLIEKGAKPDTIIGLCVERSLEMMVGMVAILKAGAAYLPLDPNYPEGRLNYIMNDSDLQLVITTDHLVHKSHGNQCSQLLLDDPRLLEKLSEYPTTNPILKQLDPNHLAYIIYTSGSTGKPKGVMIEHRSVINLANNISEMIVIDKQKKWGWIASFSFDASLQGIAMLLHGQTLEIISESTKVNMPAMKQLLEKDAINTMDCTPTLLELWLNLGMDELLPNLIIGGEPISDKLWQRLIKWQKQYGKKAINVYGPTECCVNSSAAVIENVKPNIGKPLKNYQFYVLNEYQELAPLGVIGELYIGGDGLARGYLNQPELTTERFINNPFNNKNDRIYKTGDLVRYLEDGQLTFIGRTDEQVKIRGFRIELGEIEHQLTSHPDIDTSIVIAQETAGQDIQLVAYFTSTSAINELKLIKELKESLNHHLPEYMVPSIFMLLESFSLTSNGKVNRQSLPKPKDTTEENKIYVEPEGETENKLVKIWSQLLKVPSETISADANFFELGGHSLLSIRLLAEIRSTFNSELSVKEIFSSPQLSELAKQLKNSNIVRSPVIAIKQTKNQMPLSHAQQRLWFIDQMDGGSVHYNMASAVNLHGNFKVEIAEKAFQQIVQRHEILRTVIVDSDQGPKQTVLNQYQFSIAHTDLTGLVDSEQGSQDEIIQKAIEQDAQNPFDLSQDLMLRVSCFKISKFESVLLFNMHHIASDGWSLGVLVNEFVSLYKSIFQDTPNTLKPLDIQYADYAYWQRQWLQGKVLENQLGYWDHQLTDLPVVHSLPLDFARPKYQTFNGASHSFKIDVQILKKLKELAFDNQATVFMVIHAAFSILLARYSGNSDIVVGTPVANRLQKELEPLIGFFVNTLVLRADCSGEQTFTTFLNQIKNVNLNAQSNQDVPFEHLVDHLNPTRSTSHNALFQVMISMDNNEIFELDLPDVKLSPVNNKQKNVKFDLVFNSIAVDDNLADELKSGLYCSFAYNADLFKPKTIQRMADSFTRLLKGITTGVDQKLVNLPLLSEKETNHLLHDLNDTQLAYPNDLFIHQLFEQQVQHTPNLVAVVFEGKSLTYSELNKRANKLANYLIDHKYSMGTRIGVYFEMSVELLVSVIAVLKSGSSYVALEPSHPSARIMYLIEDAKINLVLMSSNLLDIMPPVQIDYLLVDEALRSEKWLDNNAVNNPQIKMRPTQEVYSLYTSGSTGQPKGVMVNHKGLSNYIQHARKAYIKSHIVGSVVSSPLCFDATITSLLTPLCDAGFVELLVQSEDLLNLLYERLFKYQNALLFKITPAHLEALSLIRADAYSDIAHQIVVGGEQLNLNLLKKWKGSLLPEANFVNEYGPTETVVGCCVFDVSDQSTLSVLSRAAVPIGYPISNVQMYVIGEGMTLQPKGCIGELYIGGDGVANGYINKEELQALSFIDNPFGTGYLYKTGDLARFIENDALEFMGRLDDQINIRGYRVELGEIEQKLKLHPELETSLVIANKKSGSDIQLVTYFTSNSNTEQTKLINEVRESLRLHLPDYMIPSAFILLKTFPLTVNGKIDRELLPKPDAIGKNQVYIAPKGKIEEKLVSIWKDLLKLPNEAISADANFFDLGGHSLLSIRLLAGIRSTFACELSVRDVFASPQLNELAKCITNTNTHDVRPVIKPIERNNNRFSLSYAQQRLWFIDQMGNGSTHYNMFSAIRIKGDFKIEAAQQALNEIIQRHESLRTVFDGGSNGPYQIIHKDFDFEINVVNISQLGVKDQDETIKNAIQFDASKPFDLTQDLMLRSSYYQLSHDEGVMLFNVHHIASDGWSSGILADEFAKLYCAFAEGIESPLTPLPIQYSDYAHWQRNWLVGNVLKGQFNYWEKQLNNLPLTHSLMLDYERPEFQSFNGANHSFKLNKKMRDNLASIADENQVTIFMMIHAVFSILLSRYSKSTDIVIGSPVANRIQKELEPLIGFFVNTLVLRTDCSNNPRFIDFLKHIKDINLDAQANQDIPFEHLVDRLNPSRSTSHNALFQIMLNMDNNEQREFTLPNVHFSPVKNDNVTALFDLSLNVSDYDGLAFNFEYNTDLFDIESIKRMADSLQCLFIDITEDATQGIAELTLLNRKEQNHLLSNLNDTHVDHPTQWCIHELIEQQVEKSPKNVAVVFENQFLTYSELNIKANQLAHYLIDQQKIQPDDFIGLCVDRSLEMMIGLLAVLKSGAAYLPLDPSYPEDRLEHMLSDSKVKILLTQSHIRDQLLFKQQHVICLDDIAKLSTQSIENIDKNKIGLSSNNLAYIIYTSGSTGKPKGAAVEHKNETNLLYWYQDKYQINQNDKVLVLSAIGFDLTQKNLFAPLICGASVQFATSKFYDINVICDFIESNGITFTNCAPSVFYPLVEHQKHILKLKSLRCVLFGGESIAFDRLHNWIEQASNKLQLINMYGPTECTDISCSYDINLNKNNTLIPIGVANDNVLLYVLNEQQQLAPFGVEGELCVGGLGVSRGYLNQPVLTAEKFIQNPFKPSKTEKIYRTGDLVKWNKNNQLEFIGRIDNQIKIRGFRVELGEIESVLNQYKAISQSVVLFNSEKQLLNAYLIVEESTEVDMDELKHYLHKHLPSYMVPVAYAEIDVLPLTTHGKIDKNALLEFSVNEVSHTHIKPTGATEIKLAKIWSEILSIDEGQISADANFFELGGHSLIMTNMLHLIVEQMDVHLSVKDVFQAPTISDIAGIISSKAFNESQTLKKQDNSIPLPLSYGQYRIWFIEQIKDKTNEHNMTVAVKLKGDLKIDVLEKAVNLMIQQHDILRTKIVDVNNTPMQLVEHEFNYQLETVDLTTLPANEKQIQAEQLTEAHDTQVFNLSQLPLISVQLLKIENNEFILHFNQHHIISDGWSQQLFYGELLNNYHNIISAKEHIIDNDCLNYADYAVWQQEWMSSNQAEQQRLFWQTYLLNCQEQLFLPIQKNEGNLDGQQNIVKSHINASLRGQLKEIGHNHKGSLFNVLHTGFALLLSRLSGKNDFNIGLPVSGRHVYGTQHMLGMFLNTLPIRHHIDLQTPFIDLLKQQIVNVEEVLSNQDLPLEEIFKTAGCERSAESTPLFQILFNMLVVPDVNSEEKQLDFEVLPEETAEIANKFNITFYLKDSEQGISVVCQYNDSAFSHSHIQNFVDQYVSLLSQLALNINVKCGAYLLNKTDLNIAYTDSSQLVNIDVEDVTALFRSQVEAAPKSVAIRDEFNEWSYQELLSFSFELAHELGKLGVQRGDIVTIVASRQANLVAGILAVLQLGAAYSIVTADTPVNRVVQHMKIVNNNLTLLCELEEKYTPDLLERIKTLSQIKVMTNKPDYHKVVSCEFEPETDLLDMTACVTFTSGSSGIPKAVAGSHLGLSGYLKWLPEYAGFSKQDHFGMLSGLAHDPLQRDIFGALCTGATLVIPAKNDFDTYKFNDWILNQKVSVLHLTPAMAEIISMEEQADLNTVKSVFLTGEALRRDTVAALLKLNPNMQIFNCFGATETQRAATYFKINAQSQIDSVIPISLSTPDTSIKLVNQNNELCGIGEIGMICTESNHIAQGYLNDKRLTEQRFIQLENSCRRYLTGDLGVCLDGKNIKCLGRQDSQVNIRGFRVELGEIEYQLSQHESVKSCTAVVHDNSFIIAYIVLDTDKENTAVLIDGCKMYLQNHLPQHMLPSAFIALDEIPLTENRKVDRNALPSPDELTHLTPYQAPEKPIEITLSKMWSHLLKIPTEKISTNSNFFELGGHSLLLLKLISGIRESLKIEVDLKHLFEAKDLRSMADLISSIQEHADVSEKLANASDEDIEEVEF